MDAHPTLAVAAFWLVFGGLHIGLTTRRVRAALVARLGEHGFTALFSVIASASFAVAIAYYAAHRTEGAAGLAAGGVPVLREMLMAVAVLGIVFMVAGSTTYVGSPYDLLAHRIRPPRGMERITRHPFFIGLALFALAHGLLANRLAGTVLFSGVALVAVAGAYHQDRKLLRRIGRPYADYLAATSAVPFAAIVAGRQRLVWAELPFAALGASLVIAATLRAVHASLFAYDGAYVIAAVVGGALILTWQSSRRARRQAALAATSIGG
jgi:uncharacterized membrane protein